MANLARNLHLAGHRIMALQPPSHLSSPVSGAKSPSLAPDFASTPVAAPFSSSEISASSDISIMDYKPRLYRSTIETEDNYVFSYNAKSSALITEPSAQLPQEIEQLSSEIQEPAVPYITMYDCRSVEHHVGDVKPINPGLKISTQMPLHSANTDQILHLGSFFNKRKCMHFDLKQIGGDCEVHIGRDGRFYLLDLARLLPPGQC